MISTKGRYALRVMIDLAEQNSAGYIPLRSKLPPVSRFLKSIWKIILKVLVKNKLLEGAARQRRRRTQSVPVRLKNIPPETVLELTEGPLSPLLCLAPECAAVRTSDKLCDPADVETLWSGCTQFLSIILL